LRESHSTVCSSSTSGEPMSTGISMHVNELSFCANMRMGAFDNRSIAPISGDLRSAS
jgi:hypothetical protein